MITKKISEDLLYKIVKKIIKEQSTQGIHASQTQKPDVFYKDSDGITYKLKGIKDEESLNRFMNYGDSLESKASKIANTIRGGGSSIYKSLKGNKVLANYVVRIVDAYLNGVARFGLKINEVQFKQFPFFMKFMDDETKKIFESIVIKNEFQGFENFLPAIVAIVNEQYKKIA